MTRKNARRKSGSASDGAPPGVAAAAKAASHPRSGLMVNPHNVIGGAIGLILLVFLSHCITAVAAEATASISMYGRPSCGGDRCFQAFRASEVMSWWAAREHCELQYADHVDGGLAHADSRVHEEAFEDVLTNADFRLWIYGFFNSAECCTPDSPVGYDPATCLCCYAGTAGGSETIEIENAVCNYAGVGAPTGWICEYGADIASASSSDDSVPTASLPGDSDSSSTPPVTKPSKSSKSSSKSKPTRPASSTSSTSTSSSFGLSDILGGSSSSTSESSSNTSFSEFWGKGNKVESTVVIVGICVLGAVVGIMIIAAIRPVVRSFRMRNYSRMDDEHNRL